MKINEQKKSIPFYIFKEATFDYSTGTQYVEFREKIKEGYYFKTNTLRSVVVSDTSSGNDITLTLNDEALNAEPIKEIPLNLIAAQTDGRVKRDNIHPSPKFSRVYKPSSVITGKIEHAENRPTTGTATVQLLIIGRLIPKNNIKGVL